MRCPKCDGPTTVLGQFLAEYVEIKCATHGRQLFNPAAPVPPVVVTSERDDDPIVVVLPDDKAEAVRREARLIVEHGRAHKTEKYGAQESRQATRLARNEDGLGAEEAVAIALSTDRSQRGIVEAGFAPDLVNRVEVRTTRYETGRLIVHPEDPDQAPFVLAVGQLPRYRIAGWIKGIEAKQARFWDATAPFPAYFVPQRELRPLWALRRVPT